MGKYSKSSNFIITINILIILCIELIGIWLVVEFAQNFAIEMIFGCLLIAIGIYLFYRLIKLLSNSNLITNLGKSRLKSKSAINVEEAQEVDETMYARTNSIQRY